MTRWQMGQCNVICGRTAHRLFLLFYNCTMNACKAEGGFVCSGTVACREVLVRDISHSSVCLLVFMQLVQWKQYSN